MISLRNYAYVAALAALLMTVGCSDDDPTSPPTVQDPAGYTNADGPNGGQMYDKFWAAETGWNQADPNLATFSASANFFRCKQCHGWDLLGSQGAYISRGPKTSRPNVSGLNLESIAVSSTPQDLFDALKTSTGRRPLTADLATYDPATNPTVGDQMPDLGSFMTDDQLWDLVRFLKVEAEVVTNLYAFTTSGTYPSGSITYSDIGKDGSAAAGDAVFTLKCAGCHGSDGTAFLVDGAGYSVGSHLRAKPNEDQHKIKFGQLGTAMGGLVTNTTEMKNLYKALTDAVKYPDPAP